MKCQNPNCDNEAKKKYCSRRCLMIVTNRRYRQTHKAKHGHAPPRTRKAKPKTQPRQPVTYSNGVTINTHEVYLQALARHKERAYWAAK